METHHGASNHFGHQDFYAAKNQGKSITEIADWFRANPHSHVHGLNSKVYQDIAREEQQFLAQQAQKKSKQPSYGQGLDYGFEKGKGPGTQPDVKVPSVNNPSTGGGFGSGNVSPHDFASDYMRKIMDARKNGQDPLRYDKPQEDQRQDFAQSGANQNNTDQNPYDNQRYKNTQFNYDKDATKYQSPQYTG